MGPKKIVEAVKPKKKIGRSTIEMRKEIIAKYESGVRVTDIAGMFGIPRSTISTIVKQKEAIKSADVAKGVTTLTSARSQTMEQMEKLLLVWVNEKQLAGDRISEAMICKRARQLFGDIRQNTPTGCDESDEFKASRGWCENFKKRTGIHSGVRHGEAASSNVEAANAFVEDPVWLSFDRIPKSTGFTAKCRKCKQEIQGLVTRMKKHVETCQPTQTNNPTQEDAVNEDNVDADEDFFELPASESLDSVPVFSASNSTTPTVNEPERYSFQYSDHVSTILRSLADDEAFMDVTLVAEGQPLKAHKSVLSAMSSYFRGVLLGNPCQHPVIIMPHDVLYEDLGSIISYIYKGEITISVDKVTSLLRVAEILQIHGMPSSDSVSMDQPHDGSSIDGTSNLGTATRNVNDIIVPKTEPLQGSSSQSTTSVVTSQNNFVRVNQKNNSGTPLKSQQHNIPKTANDENYLLKSQNVRNPVKVSKVSLLKSSPSVFSSILTNPRNVSSAVTSLSNNSLARANIENSDAFSVTVFQAKSDSNPTSSKIVSGDTLFTCTANTGLRPLEMVSKLTDPQLSDSMDMEIKYIDLEHIKEEDVDIYDEEL